MVPKSWCSFSPEKKKSQSVGSDMSLIVRLVPGWVFLPFSHCVPPLPLPQWSVSSHYAQWHSLSEGHGRSAKSFTGPSQPFNWNHKRTFFGHKSPYVGFVAIRLTRKAREPDKKGLEEMYCWDIMLSVTWQLVEESGKAWPGLGWSGLGTTQWLMEWSKATLKTQFHKKRCLGGTSGTVNYLSQPQSNTALNSWLELNCMKLPTVWEQSLAHRASSFKIF